MSPVGDRGSLSADGLLHGVVPQSGAVGVDERADPFEEGVGGLRVEAASVAQPYGDVVVDGFLRSDHRLVRHQAVLPDAGAQGAAFRPGDLGPQPALGAARGQRDGVRQFRLGDREDRQLGRGEPGGEGAPCCSMRWATARSTLPMMLRWIMTGRCFAPSAPM